MLFAVGNAFSLNMLMSVLSDAGECQVRFTRLTPLQAVAWVLKKQPKSAVGHKETAEIISKLLGQNVPYTGRLNIVLRHPSEGPDEEADGQVLTDALLVCQYSGPRLPEGATTLPEGSRLEFVLARIVG